MRFCPDCHAPVADKANFCDNCGYPMNTAPEAATDAQPLYPDPTPDVLPQLPADAPPNASEFRGTAALRGACSACGYINLPGEMFCQNCGVQLPPVASMPPPLPRPVSGPIPGKAPAPLQSAPQPAQVSQPASPAGDAVSAAGVLGMQGRLVLRPTQQSIPLPNTGTEAILGRSDPIKGVYPHVDLSPYGGDTSGVSRRHARLVVKDGSLYIEDLNSTNFTFLNHNKLIPGQLYPLKSGDELRLGLMVLEFIV